MKGLNKMKKIKAYRNIWADGITGFIIAESIHQKDYNHIIKIDYCGLKLSFKYIGNSFKPIIKTEFELIRAFLNWVQKLDSNKMGQKSFDRVFGGLITRAELEKILSIELNKISK